MAAAGTDDSLRFALADPAATEALGRRLGARMQAGDVVCLLGDLGAGKTTLARGAIAAWTGSAEEAPSPTYTLVQVYEGARGALLHADLYRLKRPEEAEEIGLIDAFGREAVLIEWPERLGGALPKDRLEIALTLEGHGRRASVRAYGSWRGRADAL